MQTKATTWLCVVLLLQMNIHIPDVADYPEEITDADGDTYTWEHVYEGGTGMLAHIYVSDSLLYNHETRTWTNPVLRTHNNSRELTLQTWADQAAGIRRAHL